MTIPLPKKIKFNSGFGFQLEIFEILRLVGLKRAFPFPHLHGLRIGFFDAKGAVDNPKS